MQVKDDSWESGDAYEKFMGRWSRLVAEKFLEWMAVPELSSWLDVGCGTGSLTHLILAKHQPERIIGLDPSKAFIEFAQKQINHPSVVFKVGSAQSMEVETSTLDAVVSGLVLNFVPQPEKAITEMLRVLKPGGQIGIFLWDYTQGMEMLRYFWDTVNSLDPGAVILDESNRFPLCKEGALEKLMRKSELGQIEVRPINVVTAFKDFDEYWQPFLQPVGPAPGYVVGITSEARNEIESKLRQVLPVDQNGTISIKARAWAVKGRKDL